MSAAVLVRYGAIGEVARFRLETDAAIERNSRVVISSSRGLEIGTVLEAVNDKSGNRDENVAQIEQTILRLASSDDETTASRRQADCMQAFGEWQDRIREWNLDLQLIDLEWTLDGGKLILYVLNDRGPACTTLALHAAAAGLGIIEVQPVDAEGLVRMESAGGGCSSGGSCCH